MRYIYCIGLVFSFLISACKKEEGIALGTNSICPYESCGNTFNISQDLLECLYKTGTYWVYIDSVSLSVDSVSIVSFFADFRSFQGNAYEEHSFATISYPSLDTTRYRVWTPAIMKNYGEGPTSGTAVYESQDYLNNFTSNSVLLDSVFVYDQYYSNVLQVEIENDPTENGNQSFYYSNAEYGFLRHEVYASGTLVSQKVLVNKNIIR